MQIPEVGSALDRDYRIHVLVYGDPGVGKTKFWMDFARAGLRPFVFLGPDETIGATAIDQNVDVPTWQVTSLDALKLSTTDPMLIARHVCDKDGSKWQGYEPLTFVWENARTMQGLIVGRYPKAARMVGEIELPAEPATGAYASRGKDNQSDERLAPKDYGWIQYHTLESFSPVNSLPYHTIITCHLSESDAHEDKDTGQKKPHLIEPLLVGSARRYLSGTVCDFMFRLKVENGMRTVMIRGGGGTTTKARLTKGMPAALPWDNINIAEYLIERFDARLRAIDKEEQGLRNGGDARDGRAGSASGAGQA